jgi:hypothetical protein
MRKAGMGVRSVPASRRKGPTRSRGRSIQPGVPRRKRGGMTTMIRRCCTMWAERR